MHFIFKTHPAGEIYSKRPALGRSRTVIIENSVGDLLDRHSVERMKERDRFERSQKRFLLDAHQRNKKVVSGEYQGRAIRDNSPVTTGMAHALASRDPTVENIQNFFEKLAAQNRIRHVEIISRIKNSEKPVEAQYGTYHSLLSAELKKEGITSTRKMAPQVFPWKIIVMRQINTGKKPTELDFLRGFVSNKMFTSVLPLVTKKKRTELLIQTCAFIR
ncbi:MAG: hypothetical protein FJY86_01495 [Candidatus Diapherotrites archaeon]|uniref:Uncharacterized protein n=1 Tax=Candidatus Iainarchaeum sp. TaxID=3101447 RepID=A0A8T4C7U0_9ARCH|nr:hypothetical protein [Candidatus Diapherotrites archaeon]